MIIGTVSPDQEIQVLDSVIYHLSVYNGKVLEKFTHEESLGYWRVDLKEDEASAAVIEKLIADFFVRVRDKYDMLTVDDIAGLPMNDFPPSHANIQKYLQIIIFGQRYFSIFN